MKNKLIVLFLLAGFSLFAFAGLNEDYQALQRQFMKRRNMVRSQADMDKLGADRVAALNKLLNRYKGKKLTENERMTMAEIYLSLDKLQDAWTFLQKVRNPVDSEKYKAMCARALFGLKKDAEAQHYLDKMNRQSQYYGMVNLGRAMSLMKEGKDSDAVPYLQNVINVLTLRDRYRAFALNSLISFYENNGKHGMAMRLLQKAEKDNTYSARVRQEMKNLAAGMDKIGHNAVNLQNVVQRFNRQVPPIYQEKGKVVILDFFAPWNGLCRASFPWFNDLYMKYRDKGLILIGVTRLYGTYSDGKVREKSITAVKELSLISSFLKSRKISFPVAVLNKDDSFRDYAVSGLPHVVLIDKKGVIRRVFIGMYSRKSFEKALETLLNNQSK